MTNEEQHLTAELQKLMDRPDVEQARLNSMYNLLVAGRPGPIEIKDGKLHVERIEIGGDCGICEKEN